MKTKTKLYLGLILLILISGCVQKDFSRNEENKENIIDKPLEKIEKKLWAKTDPIQCLWNPWEKDWQKKHDNNYSVYPRDMYTPWLEKEEIEIIKNYYEQQGVKVFDIRAITFTEKEGYVNGVCEACDCPQGYTLYLLISEKDVDTIIELGYSIYQKSTPQEEYTCPKQKGFDCMPIVLPQSVLYCSGPYAAWIKEHCNVSFTN